MSSLSLWSRVRGGNKSASVGVWRRQKPGTDRCVVPDHCGGKGTRRTRLLGAGSGPFLTTRYPSCGLCLKWLQGTDRWVKANSDWPNSKLAGKFANFESPRFFCTQAPLGRRTQQHHRCWGTDRTTSDKGRRWGAPEKEDQRGYRLFGTIQISFLLWPHTSIPSHVLKCRRTKKSERRNFFC